MQRGQAAEKHATTNTEMFCRASFAHEAWCHHRLCFLGRESYLLRISGEVGNGEGGEDHEQRVVVEQAVFPQLLGIGEVRVLKAGSTQDHKTSSPTGDTRPVSASLVPPPQVSPVQHGRRPAYLGIQLLLDVGTVRSC